MSGAPTPDDALDDLAGKLEFFDHLRNTAPEEADAYIASFGSEFAEAQRTIIRELTVRSVIAHPDRFAETNRRLLKSVEVLYRNGRQPAPMSGWGPMRPLAQALQTFITSYITRSYVGSLLESVLELYLARENQADHGSENWYRLYVARRNLERLDARYRGDRFGIPLFLLSGAVFAAIASTLSGFVHQVFTSDLLIIGFALLLLAVLMAVGRGIAQGAGVAKRRIALTTGPAATDLYNVMGGAGQPPRDLARVFALGAVLSLLLLWVVIPGTLLGVFFN